MHKLFYPSPHILHLFGQLIEVLKEQSNFEVEGNARSHKSKGISFFAFLLKSVCQGPSSLNLGTVLKLNSLLQFVLLPFKTDWILTGWGKSHIAGLGAGI